MDNAIAGHSFKQQLTFRTLNRHITAPRPVEFMAETNVQRTRPVT